MKSKQINIMHDYTAIYKSYILRFWQDSTRLPWRATLQSIQSQEMMHFANLDALFVYLATQTVRSQIAESLPSVQENTCEGSSYRDDT